MDERILERMLDNLVEEAGPLAIEELEKEASMEEIPEHEFSKRHEKQMKKLFKEAERLEKAEKANTSKATSGTRKMSKPRKMLMFAAAIIMLMGLMVGSVGAWRESFYKCYLDVKEKYSVVGKKYVENEYLFENIYFGYLPGEYKYDNSNKTKRYSIITFIAGDNYINLESRKDSWNNRINTESGDFADNIEKEREMVYSEKDGLKMLTWDENGYTHVLRGNDSKEVITKIAENIKFVN